MKKCAFNSSFAGNDGEKTRDFSLLDSLLSIMSGRGRTSDDDNGESVAMTRTADDAERQNDADAAGHSFARSVESAKYRAGGERSAKLTQDRQSDAPDMSQNSETRKDQDGTGVENVRNRENNVFAPLSASSTEKRTKIRKSDGDYYSPPPCYRV